MDFLTRIEELRELCREEGIPLTQQRIEIYKVLLASREHPSPEIIYRKLKSDFPTLSLATVYNNLEVLSRLGIVRKLNPLSDHARYDGDLSSHTHFVCVKCKAVEDIESEKIDSIQIPDPPENGRKILGKTIQFVGICEKCQNEKQEE
ncbi:MAG: transcriptional repressor [candidate division Zixibacteria bacterium]